MIIKNKAVNLSNIVFIIYLLILPIFGKVIDSREAVIFYGFTPFLFLNIFFLDSNIRHRYSKFNLSFHLPLFILFLISTLFSINIGTSVYPLVNFAVVLLLVNLIPYYLNDINLFYKFMIGFSVIYSLIFIASYFHLISIPYAPNSDNFILRVWGHSYLSDFLIFPILILLSKINQKNFKTFLPLLLLISLTLVFTNSRSSLVAVIFAALFLAIKNRFSVWLKILFIIFVTIGLINIFYLSRPSPTNYSKSLDGSRTEYWPEAIKGFQNSPLIGNGSITFNVFNQAFRPSSQSNSNYVNNSLLQFLTDNGLIFTLIFFIYLSLGLIHQYKTNNLLFCLGLAAIINSFFDPSWSSPGILIISLLFLFYNFPTIKKSNHIFLSFLSLFIFLSCLADTTSSILYSQKEYDLSLKFNPFNLNSQLATVSRHPDQTIKLFGKSTEIYQNLITSTPLPQSEKYYYTLFNLDPKQNLRLYQDLLVYYANNNYSNKFDDLAYLMDKNLNISDWPIQDTMPIAKMIYRHAISQWQSGEFQLAINNLKIALHFSQNWGYFYIELANAYWHNNQKDQAISLLEINCPKNYYSQSQCLDYLYSHQNFFLLPGTDGMKQSISSISD